VDAESIRLDGLRVGGVGGVIGDPQRPGRRWQEDFLAAIELALEGTPDLLVLHACPRAGASQKGEAALGEFLERASKRAPAFPLVICGHRSWDTPLATFGRAQVLNVHGHAYVLRRPGRSG
jgi:hypothetical protein